MMGMGIVVMVKWRRLVMLRKRIVMVISCLVVVIISIDEFFGCVIVVDVKVYGFFISNIYFFIGLKCVRFVFIGCIGNGILKKIFVRILNILEKIRVELRLIEFWMVRVIMRGSSVFKFLSELEILVRGVVWNV